MRGNGRSDIRFSRTGVKALVPGVSLFSTDLCGVSFTRHPHSDVIAKCLSDFAQIRYERPAHDASDICKFRETRHSESSCFVLGLHETTSARVLYTHMIFLQ